jgi:hypothetical protein
MIIDIIVHINHIEIPVVGMLNEFTKGDFPPYIFLQIGKTNTKHQPAIVTIVSVRPIEQIIVTVTADIV